MRAGATGQQIYAYFEHVIAERHEQPEDDLLSGFIDAEVDGERLTTEDILDISYLFLLAGLDTVTASLGSPSPTLPTTPTGSRPLRDDPSRIPGGGRGVAALGDAGAGRPTCDDTRGRGGGDDDLGRTGRDMPAGERQHATRRSFPNRSRSTSCGRATATRVRWWRAPLPRLTPRPAGDRVALEELHRRVPAVTVTAGETPVYAMGIRSVDYLPLSWSVR